MSPLGDPGLALRLDWPFAALAFLFGSIPWGVIVSRVFFKSDIRASGSRSCCSTRSKASPPFSSAARCSREPSPATQARSTLPL
jgi:hypothetical protein